VVHSFINCTGGVTLFGYFLVAGDDPVLDKFSYAVLGTVTRRNCLPQRKRKASHMTPMAVWPMEYRDPSMNVTFVSYVYNFSG
jgi:hypothetical protein